MSREGPRKENALKWDENAMRSGVERFLAGGDRLAADRLTEGKVGIAINYRQCLPIFEGNAHPTRSAIALKTRKFVPHSDKNRIRLAGNRSFC